MVEIDDAVVGFAEYHLRGENHFFFYHTEVDEEFGGRGVGSALARFALDDVRKKGGLVVPLCPFIAAFMDTHPEYDDLADVVIMRRVDDGGKWPTDLVRRVLAQD